MSTRVWVLGDAVVDLLPESQETTTVSWWGAC